MNPVNYPITQKAQSYAWKPNFISRNNNVYLKLDPGTVNNLLPTNWQTEFLLTKNITNYIKLRISANGSSSVATVNGCQIIVDSTEPTPTVPQKNFPPTTYDLLIGLYYESEYKSIFSAPIFIYPIIFFTTPKSNPVPGTESFDKYFVWQYA